MPVLTMEKTSAPVHIAAARSIPNFVTRRIKLPAWSVVSLVLLAAAAGLSAGRRHPAHHYVAYFGYPMVMDTTTGKACYAVPPKPAAAVQDADFPVDGTANPVDQQAAHGPAIPLCGQE